MKEISKIDKNFCVPDYITEPDICWLNGADYVYGLKHDTAYRRLDTAIAQSVNEGVVSLATNTAGGRLRFITNSEYIAISAKMPSAVNFSHMPATGVRGFDLYVDNLFAASFVPPTECSGDYDSIIHLNKNKLCEITINFPLYNDVTDVYIGIQKDAVIRKAPSYNISKPVIFYGSSITQGGCASRPGLSYPAILSRTLSFDYINLGFSGSGLGEVAMAEYIAKQEMSVFVYDYDHNAPTYEHLEKTHKAFFEIIRKNNPTLPIIMITKPDIRFCLEAASKRRELIIQNYENAVNSGDKNVYFIDGETLWGNDGWDSCTVDALHPSDMGHWRMAQTILPTLKKILSGE